MSQLSLKSFELHLIFQPDIISHMSKLIKLIIQGNTTAIFIFYKKYSPKILKYTSGRLPSLQDSQEITQDVFLDAIDSLPLLKEETKILNWLYTIAHNKVVNFYRKRKLKTILLSQIPFLELISREIDQPEFQLEKNRVRYSIERTFHAIPEKYRNILILHYEQQIPVKDLALLFNLTFKATESMLFRARKSFKEAYERT